MIFFSAEISKRDRLLSYNKVVTYHREIGDRDCRANKAKSYNVAFTENLGYIHSEAKRVSGY